MADKTTPPPQYHFAWSAISPTDLGLKAGFWTREAKDPLQFKEIVGWVTVVGRQQRPDAAPENAFQAIVLDDTWYPQIARVLPGYSGVFPKKTSEEEAKALAREWSKPKAEHAQPNMKGGLA